MAEARRMGKSELFSHFAERFEVKRTQSREFFDELASLCEKELKRSGEFVLPGMVKLVVQKRKARMGRNPATGEPIKIPGEDRRQGAHRQAAQGRRSAAQVALRTPPGSREETPPAGVSFSQPTSAGYTPLMRRAISRISRRSILNFSVDSGTPR